ncbi:MAG: polysaccharide deacetylase family protein [Desulfovibrionaceae bacterium]
MPAICCYFQIHQPYRLRRYTVFDMGQNSIYEDDDKNCDILLRVARTCYLPMNELLHKHIRTFGKRFKVAFSISGTALDQFEQYAPEVIDSFQGLAATGCIEFLSETYNHSLAFLYSRTEFERQVQAHADKIYTLFGQKPTVFRNTELIYNNDLAKTVEDMGYAGILAEGADHVLGWRSPNFVYLPSNCLRLKLLLKNYQLSNDISLRFSDKNWDAWPLTADVFASWCHAINGEGETINLFMDYECFGETHAADTGIFHFMEALPAAVLAHPDFSFQSPTEVLQAYSPMAKVDVPQFMSWADAEHDITAWIGNDMQQDAIEALYALEPRVIATGNADFIRTWQRLQSADHFYYMCTKWFADVQARPRYTPFSSPYDAYITFMNVLADFTLNLDVAAAQDVRLALAPKTAPKKTSRPQAPKDTAKKTTKVASKKPATEAAKTAKPKTSTPKPKSVKTKSTVQKEAKE